MKDRSEEVFPFDKEALYKGKQKALYKIKRVSGKEFFATGFNYYGTWKENARFGDAWNISDKDITEDKDDIKRYNAELSKRGLDNLIL